MCQHIVFVLFRFVRVLITLSVSVGTDLMNILWVAFIYTCTCTCTYDFENSNRHDLCVMLFVTTWRFSMFTNRARARAPHKIIISFKRALLCIHKKKKINKKKPRGLISLSHVGNKTVCSRQPSWESASASQEEEEEKKNPVVLL